MTSLTPEPTNYLDLTKLHDGIFQIGVLDVGVTILSQQIRALNLVWALDRTGQLAKAEKIAVVGGGIAGLTAAMALRHIFSLDGFQGGAITLFEARSVLCPLQRGCATRWVHPHIYDWPLPGSTNPSAGLPVMNWRAGRASDVAATIVKEWERETTTVAVSEWRNLRYLRIDHVRREIEWVGENNAPLVGVVRGDKQQFDIIILAIGFGDEHGAPSHLSYWRNETYGQPDLTGRQKRYLVSGTGDGGLIDLLRLRITDFREDRIGHELAPEGSTEFKEVLSLRADCYQPSVAGSSAELFDRARRLGRDMGLVNTLKGRLRADNIASLQVKKGSRVSDAFQRKSSFVNRFLVSLLFEAGGFTPRFGVLDPAKVDAFDEVIVRHGTNNREHLLSIFTADVRGLVEALDERRKGAPAIEHPEQIGFWETGWPFNRKKTTGPGSFKRDYVPDATIAISSAFVSALAPLFAASGGGYRATLHRVVGTRAHGASEVHLQQIANYHGPRARPEGAAVTGRLFRIDDAVIGLAARSRRILVTPPISQPAEVYKQRLREDMGRLNGDKWDPKRMDDEVAALLACPLVFRGDSSAASEAVVGVLFADSTEVGAFDDSCVARIIQACEEFGNYLGRISKGDAPEAISVKGQATCHTAPAGAQDLDGLAVLKASDRTPPLVPVEFINLEWWA